MVTDTIQVNFDTALARGLLLRHAQVLSSSNLSHEKLDKAVLASRLFYVEVAGVRAYPAFYFGTRYDRAQLFAVTKTLGYLSGGSKWQFFMTPKGSLARSDSTPRTPLQALEDGDIELVKRAALGFVQR